MWYSFCSLHTASRISVKIQEFKMADPDQAKFQVHHVRFFEYQPQPINCMSQDASAGRIAVARLNASVEILNSKENWIQEMVFPAYKDASVEALIWCKGRLFAGGISGNVVELDLTTQLVKNTVSSNAGAVWCLAKNSAGDQLAAGTEDGCVVLFDVSEELKFLRGFGKQEGRILSVAWYNRDGENVIVTGGINNIRQWSVKSGQPISRMTLGRKSQQDTVIWCIAVTKDFTIVSGDSRGVVTFWNGKESTQLKTFHCHKADVLALCLSDDETTVYTGGVEGAVYQFTLHAADPSSERKRWGHLLLHNRHTHDIRAMSYVKGFLVTGGVDTHFYVAKVQGRRRSVLQLAPVQVHGLIHVAADNLIQLQYQDYIEVWRLGSASPPLDEARGMLPLVQNRIKLLKLTARKGHEILSSCLSNDGIIAFSDTKGIRLFKLNVTNESSSTPLVTLDHMDCRFAHPAHHLAVTPDGNVLVAVLVTGSVQLMNLKAVKANLVLTNMSDSQIHRVAISPDSSHLAVATLDHGVHIYSILSGQHIASCPVLTTQVSALAFSPHSPVLAIAYCNHSIYEFDVDKKEYTKWSRDYSKHFGKSWLKPLKNIVNLAYSPDSPGKFVFHTESVLCVLDKTLVPKKPEDKGHGLPPLAVNSVARICYKYKYLLFAGFTSSGMLVVVERPPSEIEEHLPPSFKQKKFGVS